MAGMDRRLTADQRCTLARLQHLLARRSAVRAYSRQTHERPEPWLVHALDHAIASYYRLAWRLGLGQEASTLLGCYREAFAAGRVCRAPLRVG